MKKKEIKEIKTSEYKIENIWNEMILYTKNLEKEIAFVCFSPELDKVGLARNLNEEQFRDFFEKFGIDKAKNPIRVSIVGGDKSPESSKNVENLVKLFIDKGNEYNDIIDITSFDVGDRIHPDSFSVSCVSGLIYEDIVE